MGGASDPAHFIGHNYTYIGSSPGVIVKALCEMKSKDGFIYFDEFDKIFAQNAETNKISHTFLHISDPTQQNEFQDQYMPEIKIDLSHITFIYSFNEKNNINPILLNRIPIIEVAGYSFAEKMVIARDYLVPRACATMRNNTDNILKFTDDALAHLIHTAENIDKHGIRTLKHLITEVITKLNILTITDSTAESNPLKLSYSLRKTDITTVDMAVLNALKLRAPENNNYRDMYL
jgi:ATP-dependent Lon protease